MTQNSADSPPPKDLADLRAMLGRFSEARCVLESAVRSLEQWQDLEDDQPARRNCDIEIVCLRHALRLLAAVYDELDMAIARRATSSKGARRGRRRSNAS
jgi:hypothetical protein